MLANKTVVLGVTGGIAAYKAADLASKLTQAGAKVEVIMTESATKFVAPLTFRSLTARHVITDMFAPVTDWNVAHVAMADKADVVVIAPATANTIARIAAGIADEMLTCTVLSTRAPVIVVPAMDVNMFENQITQENLARLKARGFTIIEPGYGRLASGKVGRGRLPDNEIIIATIKQVLGRSGDLAGKRIVVTAGGTREPIDPVRIITNRSSGKMGYALAEAARDRGASVSLITASDLSGPAGTDVVRVETASQMKEAVDRAVASADALIMAAAVADYRPKAAAREKIKKATAGLTLELVRTPDILGEVKGTFVKVGFAAETGNLVENARKKLSEKHLDLIVANDISDPAVFGADTNKVVLIGRNGEVEDLPLMTKREVAEKILDRIVAVLSGTTPAPAEDRRGSSTSVCPEVDTKDLQAEYGRWKPEIEKVWQERKESRSDDEMTVMLASCILDSRMGLADMDKALEKLIGSGALFHEGPAGIKEQLKDTGTTDADCDRLANQLHRARESLSLLSWMIKGISDNRIPFGPGGLGAGEIAKLYETGQLHDSLVKIGLSADGLREAVRLLTGADHRETSLFLTSLGFEDYAVLDAAALDELARYGVTVAGAKPASLTREQYVAMEKEMGTLAESAGIPFHHLDVLWRLQALEKEGQGPAE